jgi:hypothetical protein
MKTKGQMTWALATLIAAALFLWGPLPEAIGADSEDYLTVEEYIEQARPYLHMSCEAAWAEAEEDADAYVEIVDKVSAISFLNHDLDIEDVYDHSAEDVEALRVAYYTEVGSQCKENPNNLLAGVVERALLGAFNKVAPEAIDD